MKWLATCTHFSVLTGYLILVLSVTFLGCKKSDVIRPEQASPADQLESSGKTSDFLVGTYTVELFAGGVPNLYINQPGSLPGVTTSPQNYSLLIAPGPGDSIRVTLTGSGPAGTYANYWVGTYAATSNFQNPPVPIWQTKTGYGKTYLYDLVGRGGDNSKMDQIRRIPSQLTGTAYWCSIGIFNNAAYLTFVRQTTGIWK